MNSRSRSWLYLYIRWRGQVQPLEIELLLDFLCSFLVLLLDQGFQLVFDFVTVLLRVVLEEVLDLGLVSHHILINLRPTSMSSRRSSNFSTPACSWAAFMALFPVWSVENTFASKVAPGVDKSEFTFEAHFLLHEENLHALHLVQLLLKHLGLFHFQHSCTLVFVPIELLRLFLGG